MEQLTNVQRAYGLLWQSRSTDRRALQARALLLAMLAPEQQRAAIEWAGAEFGWPEHSDGYRIDRAGKEPKREV